MIRAALALAMLCLVLPTHAQAQSSGGRGPIPPDVARWMYDNDPERQRERLQSPQRLAQYSRCWVRDCSDAGKASDEEIAAGIDLVMATKICSGSPHPYSLTWQHGAMTCADIRWLDRFYRIQREFDETRPDRPR